MARVALAPVNSVPAGAFEDDVLPRAIPLLAFASSSLYERVTSGKAVSPADRLAAWRYLLRSARRATPFGNAAGILLCSIGSGLSHIAVTPQDSTLYVRLDASIEDQLAQSRFGEAPTGNECLVFTSPDVLVGEGTSHAFESDNLRRQHRIVRIEGPPAIHALLDYARGGARADELRAYLHTLTGWPTEECREVIQQLICEELLLDSSSRFHDAATAGTGEVLIRGVHASTLPWTDAWPSAVVSAKEAMRIRSGVAHGVEERWPSVSRATVPVRAVTVLESRKAVVSNAQLTHLASTLAGLWGVSPTPRVDPLRLVAKRFERFFGSAWIELATVAAPELGILDSLWDVPQQDADHSHTDRFVIDRLSSLRQGPWSLTDADLAALRSDTRPTPVAFTALVTLARSAEDAYQIHWAGGPSAIAYCGRFAAATHALKQELQRLADMEQAAFAGEMLAEILYFPRGRERNVCEKTSLYGAAITFGGGRSVAEHYPGALIPWERIRVAVRDGRFVLADPHTGTRVRPRLTSAHNVRECANLPYIFLASVADAESALVAWDWGQFAAFHRLPRVTWGNAVVSPARWQIQAAGSAELSRLRDREGLPRWTHLRELGGMLLDLDAPAERAEVEAAVARHGSATLSETIVGPERSLAFTGHQPLVCQCTVMVVEATSSRRSSAPPLFLSPPGQKLARDANWEALHVFGRTEPVEAAIRRAACELADRKWFFVRYAEDGWHVRIRVWADDTNMTSRPSGAALLAGTLLRDVRGVERISIERYHSEEERYGGHLSMMYVESIFVDDSRWAVAGSELSDLGDLVAAALRAIQLARAAGLSAPAAADYFGRMKRVQIQHAVAAAGASGASVRNSLLFVRDAHTAFHELDFVAERAPNDMVELLRLFAPIRVLEVNRKLTRRLTDILAAVIHMSVNRRVKMASPALESAVYGIAFSLLRRTAASLPSNIARALSASLHISECHTTEQA